MTLGSGTAATEPLLLGENTARAMDFDGVDDVEYEAENFDSQLIVKGLHTVRGKVEFKPRNTILPPDLFEQGEKLMFWVNQTATKAYRIVPQQEAENLEKQDSPGP